MLTAKISDGRTCLYQWDTGVKFELCGCETVTEMHFVTPNGLIKRDVSDNICSVPDVALQTAGTLTIYAFVRDDAHGITRHEICLGVIARPKPADYIDPPDESAFIDQVCDRLKVLPECKGPQGVPGPQGPQGPAGDNTAALEAAQTANSAAAAANEAAAAAQAVVDTVVPDINQLKGDMSDKLPKSPLVWEPWTAEEQAAALEKLGGASAGWKTSQIIEITEDIKLLNINFDGGSVLNEIAIIVDGIGTGVASKYKITVNHSNGYEFICWNDSAITINTKYTTYVYLRRFGNYWKSESINPRTPGVYGSTPTTKIIPYNTRQPVNATNIERIGLAEYDLGIGSKVYVMTR